MSYIIEESLRRLKRLNESEDGLLKKIPDDYFEKLDIHGTCSCEHGEDPRNLHNEAVIYWSGGYWVDDDSFCDHREENDVTKVVAYKIEYTGLEMEKDDEPIGSCPEDTRYETFSYYVIPDSNITSITPGVITLEHPSGKFISFEPADTFTAENGVTYDIGNISKANKGSIVYAAEEYINYVLKNSKVREEY